MLILTRTAGQSVDIDDEIVITVISISGRKVKLGFQAPDGHEIWRSEVVAELDQAQGADQPT